MRQHPSRSDSGVCCGSGCYICSIGVKIPKLAFRHASCIIVRIVQQVFDKNDFVDVVGFVKNFTSRFNSHTFYEGKSTVDGGRPCVTSNIGTVCEGLKFEISAEVGVVPVVDIVPISHKELLAAFSLLLTVARDSERSTKVELDVFCLFEIAGALNIVLRIYS